MQVAHLFSRLSVIFLLTASVSSYASPQQHSPKALTHPKKATVKNHTYLLLDYDYIMTQAPLVQRLHKAIQRVAEQYQENFAQEDAQLKQAHEELSKKQQTLSENEFKPQYEAFKQRVDTLQKMVQDRRAEINAVYKQLMTLLHAAIQKIAKQCLKKYSADLVLNSSSVLVQNPDCVHSITEEVTQELDKSAVVLEKKISKLLRKTL